MANLNQYAAIDGDGHFGARAKVYFVGSRAQCEAYVRRGGMQVIDGDGLDVGDKVLCADVPRAAARYRAAVEESIDAAECALHERQRETDRARLAELNDAYARRGALTSAEYAERDKLSAR